MKTWSCRRYSLRDPACFTEVLDTTAHDVLIREMVMWTNYLGKRYQIPNTILALVANKK